MKFFSKYRKYTMWLEPSYMGHEPNGKAYYVAGKSVQFVDNEFETEDVEIIARLKGSPMLGVDFWVIDEGTNKPEEIRPQEVKVSPSGKWVCEICGKELSTRLALSGHKRSHK